MPNQKPTQGDAAQQPDGDDDASGSRHSSAAFEQEYQNHEQSLGSEIGNAGRKLIGKVKRVVRNPENHKHPDDGLPKDQ